MSFYQLLAYFFLLFEHKCSKEVGNGNSIHASLSDDSSLKISARNYHPTEEM